MGHIADFESGRHLVPGEPFNIAEGELSANVYAARQLLQRQYFTALAFWLAAIEGSMALSSVPAVAAAAHRQMRSAEYRGMRQLVYPQVQIFLRGAFAKNFKGAK